MSERRWLGTAAAVALAVFVGQPPPVAAKRATACERWATVDLLCREYGVIESAPPYASEEPVFKRVRVAARLSPRSTVRVNAKSSARLSFGRQARCTFGLNAPRTEFITRYSDDGISAPPLYWQILGRSRCEYAGRARSVEYYCNAAATCPVRATTKGYALTDTSIVRTARASQYGDTQTIVTVARLAFCAEYYRVEVSRAFGYALVEGTGDSDTINDVTRLYRKHVTITETATVSSGVVFHSIDLRGERRRKGDVCRIPEWSEGN